MSYRIGSGFLASPGLETSVANLEVIPSPPPSWTVGYSLYKFTLMNDDDCRVLLNNDPNPKFIRAGQGLNISEIDVPITSLKFIESGVTFNWFGAY